MIVWNRISGIANVDCRIEATQTLKWYNKTKCNRNGLVYSRFQTQLGNEEDRVRRMTNMLRNILLLGLVSLTGTPVSSADETPTVPSQVLIGYTKFRTNLPGGRQANVATMRAHTVRADGMETRELADSLSKKPGAWTQFAGWSPNGKLAIIGNGWVDPENARWEEEHKAFRFTTGGRLYDMHLLDIPSGKATNLTAIQRVSDYNSGLFFWPKDSGKLGFQALIDGISHPFRMDRDGRNKEDLTRGSKGFAYGFNASPDGKRIAYHKSYQVYLADADGSNALHVKTGQPFNFVPTWSPDGKSLVLLSGEHYNCHPYIVQRDGTGLKKISDRGGYRGVVEFLDVFDYHGGSSDTPIWSTDSKAIYHTARVADSVELMRVSLDGKVEQLTHSPPGSLNYHPHLHPSGQWVLFGSNRNGTRQLYIMHLASRKTHAITSIEAGWGAMWPFWQPAATADASTE